MERVNVGLAEEVEKYESRFNQINKALPATPGPDFLILDESNSASTPVSLFTRAAHLYKLANFPVVLHVSLQPHGFAHYSVITSIQNSG